MCDLPKYKEGSAAHWAAIFCKQIGSYANIYLYRIKEQQFLHTSLYVNGKGKTVLLLNLLATDFFFKF